VRVIVPDTEGCIAWGQIGVGKRARWHGDEVEGAVEHRRHHLRNLRAGDLLVGNFGNGRIHAFDPTKLNGQGGFQHRGPVHCADGPPIVIDGLWAIAFGSGAPNNGPTDTLFVTAGPFDEGHGLFGSLVVAPNGY
jgi:hypothetical protein